MYISTFCFLLMSSVMFMNINAMVTPSFVCRRCTPSDCDVDPVGVCVWGEVRDACNRRVCAKGPGERCGGAYYVLGKCGEGMMCKADEKCHGCSLQTMECYNN